MCQSAIIRDKNSRKTEKMMRRITQNGKYKDNVYYVAQV